MRFRSIGLLAVATLALLVLPASALASASDPAGTGVMIRSSSGRYQIGSPDVSGDVVAWSEMDDNEHLYENSIWTHNLATGTSAKLSTPFTYNKWEVKTDGRYIVWEQEVVGGFGTSMAMTW